MATCIACNAYFDPSSNTGAWCSRCETNNREWLNWRRRNEVERGGRRGVLTFTKPHCYLPLAITVLSIILGLLAIFKLWADIKPGFRALAALVTPISCLLSLQGIYEARMHIRRNEMLRRVKRGWRKGISVQMITLLLPAVAMSAVLLLTYAVIKFDDLWELVKWLALTEAPETGESLREKILAVLPFVSIVGYVALAISFTASSSLMLARRYIKRLNEFLPQPIFLQDENLARVVRKEAEVELGRRDPEAFRQDNPEFDNVGLMAYAVQQLGEQIGPQHLLPENVDRRAAGADQTSSQASSRAPSQGQRWFQAATWIWDELERTEDGGIKMKVAREEIYQLPKPAKDSGYIPHTRVSYTVRADPWGRITEIKRANE